MMKSKFSKFVDVFYEYLRETSDDYVPRDIFGLAPKPSAQEEFAGIAYLQSRTRPKKSLATCHNEEDENDVPDGVRSAVRIGKLLRRIDEIKFRAACRR
jgi:hypothetical protein